jgi:hypothetical protein
MYLDVDRGSAFWAKSPHMPNIGIPCSAEKRRRDIPTCHVSRLVGLFAYRYMYLDVDRGSAFWARLASSCCNVPNVRREPCPSTILLAQLPMKTIQALLFQNVQCFPSERHAR